MLTVEATGREEFAKGLWQAFSESVGHGASDLQTKMWERFQEEGLPHPKTEVFRYVRLRELYSRSFQLPTFRALPSQEDIRNALLPNAAKSNAVFVNGAYRPELSCLEGLPASASLSPLQEAQKKFSGFLRTRWLRQVREEKDPFALVNASLAQRGAFLHFPPGCVMDSPLQLLFFTMDEGEGCLISPRFQGYLGAQAQLNILQTHICLSSQKDILNQVLDLTLDEGARLVLWEESQGDEEQLFRLSATRVRLKRDAYFQGIMVTSGAATHRQDYHVVLEGENGEADLNGLWLLRDRLQSHSHVLMEHQAPHCRSNQLFKGVLTDQGYSSFEGKIYVHQAAQKTDAFQLNNNLLLSPGAQAFSKPNLEIFADDVKASHGSTVGSLNQEMLFYLKTRGLSFEQGAHLLVQGFAEEVVDKISDQPLRERALRAVSSFF